MKNCAYLWCVLFLVMLFSLASGIGINAVGYWNELGNNLFNQGDTKGAIYCYDKAIELGNQTNAPIFTKIATQCRYTMDAINKNNRTQIFSRICAEPINSATGQPNSDYGAITLSFDVSNPNSMHMRICNICIEVINYISTMNLKIIENFGVKKTRGYSCNIKPDMDYHKCIPTTGNDEFIDLAPGELEHFAINASSDTSGAYKIRISLDYAIGSETKNITVGDVPGMIGFFNKSIT
jgi:hypothetical protein